MNILLGLLVALAVLAWWLNPAWRENRECHRELCRIEALAEVAETLDDGYEVEELRLRLSKRLRRPLPARWGFTL